MKVLIVLALAFAVANAGFTGLGLVKQTKPLLDQAINTIKADLAAKVPARNSAEAGFQTQFVNAISEHATNILNHIESAVNGMQETAQHVVSSLHSAATQLQGLGQQAVTAAQGILANLWASITGSSGRNSGRSSALAALIHQVATSPAFLNQVHSTGAYKCMKEQGVELEFEVLVQLYREGTLGVFLDTSAEVAFCVNKLGGITAMVHGSALIQWGSNLAATFGLTGTIHGLILEHGGEVYAPEVVAALESRPKVQSGRTLPPALSALVQSIASDETFLTLLRASDFYKCLKRENVPLSLEYVIGLVQGGIDNILGNAAIAQCIGESDGIYDLIAGSPVVDYVQAQIAELNIGSIIHSIIQQYAPDLADLIIGALGSNGRFLGGIWDSISGAASNVWHGMTSQVASIADNIANTASQAWASASDAFKVIKYVAQALVQAGITNIQEMTENAKEHFLQVLSTYAADLGTLYDQTVAQVHSIWNGIQLPSWQSRHAKAF